MAHPPDVASRLAGQRVLFIGGTGGVGIAVSQALLQSGVSVVLAGSRDSKVQLVLDQLMSQYPNLQSCISGHVCDLASSNAEENVKALFNQLGPLNHIIYVAGDRLSSINVVDITAESISKTSQIRVTGALLVVKHGISHLKSSPTSSLILTSGSIASKPIPGGWSLLAFVEAGIGGLTRQLALELAPIRVNCVAPGAVATDLWGPMDEKAKQEAFANHTSNTCTGRLGQAADIAESYLYLLKDNNCTGSMIDTNGGQFLE